MRFALINLATNNVDNTIEAEPDWEPPEGFIIVQSDEASTGWSYIDGVFAPPPPPILTPEQILANNKWMQNNLMYLSPKALMALLMASDFGDRTDSAAVETRSWQAYYQEVLAVDLTLTSPDWPSAPA